MYAGVNGAGKTTQLQIITGALQPDMGNIVKARANLKIAYLTQEFDVEPSRTVREEFYSAYGAQMAVRQLCGITVDGCVACATWWLVVSNLVYACVSQVSKRMDEIQQELESVTDDMDAMGALLDELAVLSNKAVDLDQGTIDKSIDQVRPDGAVHGGR